MATDETAFKIELPKLALGRHAFRFQLGRAFLDAFENDTIEDAEVTVDLTLDKSPTMLDARFALAGALTLTCDRCLQPYPQPTATQFRIIYSFDKDLQAVDAAEITYLPRNTQFLDVSQDVYDFVALQVPFRKVPAACETEPCPNLPDALKPGRADDETVDPRWNALQQLRNQTES